MTISVEGLGPLIDLATAVGLVDAGGQFDAGWFTDPGARVGGMLRRPHQREALLRTANQLLSQGKAAHIDDQGRRWVEILAHGALKLHLIVGVDGAVTEVGIGAMVKTTEPASSVQVRVPLLRVPESGPVQVAFIDGIGRVTLEAEVSFAGPSPGAGEIGLQGIAIRTEVATDGKLPVLSLTLRGLKLPGQSTASDVSLGGGQQDLAEQAIRLIAGLVQNSIAAASGDMANLLALIGFTDDARIPLLPVEELVTQGLPAWQRWLERLLDDQDAIQAWLGQVVSLVQHGAVLIPANAPTLPHRVRWTLGNGLVLTFVLQISRTPNGALGVDLGLEAWLAAGGAPGGGLELSAVLTRIVLGAVPSIAGLPHLEFSGRIGPRELTAPSDGLIDRPGSPAVRLGSLRLGASLAADRRAAFVLAAHDVTIGTHSYPILDLTNPQTLADVGDGVIEDVAKAVLDQLGTAGTTVRVLLGLTAPDGQSGWTPALTTLPDLLANPPRALLAYHQRVIDSSRSLYAAVLDPLRRLLAVPGVDVAISGDGEISTPWRLKVAEGLCVAVWIDGSKLVLGLEFDAAVTDLGGGCPTVKFGAMAHLFALALSGNASTVLPGASVSLTFGARGNVPLRIGDDSHAILAQRAGIELRWSAESGLEASLAMPGLAVVVDGVELPFKLPALTPDGRLTSDVPWRAVELLAGEVLVRLGESWTVELAESLGWRPVSRGNIIRLSLESLASDPVAAVRAWLSGYVGAGRLAELTRRLALVIVGPVGPEVPAGRLRGRGDANSPFAIPLTGASTANALHSELLLWADDAGFDLDWLDAVDLIDLPATPEDEVNPAGRAGVIAAALRAACLASPAVAALLEERGDIESGLASLLTRLVDTDGLVRAADAVLPGAVVHDMSDLDHLSLPSVNLAGIANIGLASGTIAVTTAFGPRVWPGIDEGKVVDLTAPGLAPEAFDLTRLANEDGPWLVLLPRRADAASRAGDDGAAAQAARLARVVDAVASRIAGAEPVALVAHGAAGHAATAVAARGAVTHLITLGTPHGGVGLDVLESQPIASAMRLLAEIAPPASGDDLPGSALGLGRGLIGLLDRLYQVPGTPLADLTPTSTPPTIPDGVEVHCVRGRCGGRGLVKAIAALVAHGLRHIAQSTDVPANSGALALGANVSLDFPAAPGELHVRVDLAVTMRAFSGEAKPGLRVRVGIGRNNGWLSGGPDPARSGSVSRHPSLRRAEIEVDLAGSGPSSARIVLHEASALGIALPRWVVSHIGTGEPLTAEARVLVDRLASALGPLPDSGPARRLIDLLAAAGLIDESNGALTTGAPIGFAADAVRRLLVDPDALFRDAVSAGKASRLAQALASLTSMPAPPNDLPSTVQISIDPFMVNADLAAGTVHCVLSSLPLHAGARLDASLDLLSDRSLSGRAKLALGDGMSPNGRPVLDFAAAPLDVRLSWEGAGAGMPESVQLAPQPDTAGLARIVVASVPAQLLWAGITYLRSLQAGTLEIVDPLLKSLGLLRDSDTGQRVAIPLALLAAPRHWLSHQAVLGLGTNLFDPSRVTALMDAVAALMQLPKPAPGSWGLPYGFELSVRGQDGQLQLLLAMHQPIADTDLRVGGSLGLTLAIPSMVATPAAELVLALPGTGSLESVGRITASLGPAGVKARLTLPDSGIDLPLLPNGPGLEAVGQAVTAAVTRALPWLLDVLSELPVAHPAYEVGQAIAKLGDALDLRIDGHFVADEIDLLAANPAAQFAQRLQRKLLLALDALSRALAPAIPTGYSLALSGNDLVFAFNRGVSVELRLTAPSGGLSAGVRLTGTVSGLHPLASTLLGGALIVDASGLVEARANFAVDPAQGIQLGPIVLAPRVELAIGNAPAGGARFAVGLAAPSGHTVSGVLSLAPPVKFALEAGGAMLPEALVELLMPLAADVTLSLNEVKTLLGRAIFGTATLRNLLERVVFTTTGDFDAGVLDPSQLWTRLLRLAGNIAGHLPKLPIDPLIVQLSKREVSVNDAVYGIALSLPPGERHRLVASGVTMDVEIDSTWVTGPSGTDGITIELLQIQNDQPRPYFGLGLRGVGLRFGRTDGPLLDSFVVLDTVAMHGLLVVDGSGVKVGGGQLELGNLHVALGSTGGGSNPVAAGLLRDSASAGEKPEPRFSPALAVQAHDGTPVRFDLRAGQGEGPWWLAIQHAFGPVYIEQVGFGVGRDGDKLNSARVMVDGNVSLLGFTVAVDDLALGARWPLRPEDPPLYDPRAWEIGLAGLSVAASTGGVTIAGGLRKSPGALPDYVGMISIRFGVYGISAYGGYGVVADSQGNYTSLFIFGAVNAPIGGPPAFFVTGIGAGVGVNRRLLLPANLNEFPSYPFLQALDRNSPMANPESAIDALRAYFPPSRGAFWLAAGLSFNSFSLVDGIAVLGIAVGDGLDINLMGLARAGLPNPSAPLVQIELALLARFSTREGVLWIQAQLTDNSFVLTRDCRLTGGFAFVMWFKGDKAGEFVLTLGGYHPSFHRDGYPAVPRLGFVWSVSDVLVIKGESYFALTSEALMIGTRFEASLTLGALWAYLRMGADGIVYFDPFHFEVTAFAELGAGITIDVDLGLFGHLRITFAINLHADVLLEGPEFRGRATVDLDVTSATIEFGDWADRSTPALAWPDFEHKYLRPGGANIFTAVTGRGTLPPNPADSKKAPVGTSADPFLVLPEFEVTVTSTAAVSAVNAGPSVPMPFPVYLAIGVMQLASVSSTLAFSLRSTDGIEHVGALAAQVNTGRFPKGVWGIQPQTEPRPVPTGDTVEAANGVTFSAQASISVGTVEIDYRQVEIGKRHQLPFLSEHVVRAERDSDVLAAAAIVDAAPSSVSDSLTLARTWLSAGANGTVFSPLAAAVFTRARSAPLQLVPLTFGMAVDPGPPVTAPQQPPPDGRPPDDTLARAPRVDAILSIASALAPPATLCTTVGPIGDPLPHVTPRRMAELMAASPPLVAARLTKIPALASVAGNTLIATGTLPHTGRAGTGSEQRRQIGDAPWRTLRLNTLTEALPTAGFDLLGGELVVLSAQNAQRDVRSDRPTLVLAGDLAVRIVTLDPAGEVTMDRPLLGNGAAELPLRTERIVLLGGSGPAGGVAGWHSGTRLAQVGANALMGPGCTVISSALRTQRPGGSVSAAVIPAADAVKGYCIVTTRLPADSTAVAIVLETVTRGDDIRADALDLGLAGAARAAGPQGQPQPPLAVVCGNRMVSVFAIVPDGNNAPVEVTVASGENFHLGGVIGGRFGAVALAESLRRADLSDLLTSLCTAPLGRCRLKWQAQAQPIHS